MKRYFILFIILLGFAFVTELENLQPSTIFDQPAPIRQLADGRAGWSFLSLSLLYSHTLASIQGFSK